jgi:hypothetical protein
MKCFPAAAGQERGGRLRWEWRVRACGGAVRRGAAAARDLLDARAQAVPF